MRYLSFLVLICIWTCTSSDKKMTAEEKQKIMDSLKGSYSTLIREDGILIQEDVYEHYKLSTSSIIRNNQVVDVLMYDSTGNIAAHLPLLVWDNSDTFFFDDKTLDFKIENVDSLKYYVYDYEFDRDKYEKEGLKDFDLSNPVDYLKEPLIRIPKEEVNNQDEIFIMWGYLKESQDSASYKLVTWILNDSYFKLR